MKTHHCNFRQAAVAVALALWLAWASGCMTTNTGPTLPPAIPVELERASSKQLTKPFCDMHRDQLLSHSNALSYYRKAIDQGLFQLLLGHVSGQSKGGIGSVDYYSECREAAIVTSCNHNLLFNVCDFERDGMVSGEAIDSYFHWISIITYPRTSEASASA